MPHITVDYAVLLDGVFDRRAFADELHPLVVAAVDSAGVCKMFFRPLTDTFVGGSGVGGSHVGGDMNGSHVDGGGVGGGDALVHVDIGLLHGRTHEQKAALSDAVLALLDRHLAHVDTGSGRPPTLSVEVRDLAPSYRLNGGRVPAPG